MSAKVFFFRGDRYLRYDAATDRCDEGYPLSIGDYWPGMRGAGFDQGVQAAVNWGNGKLYFFKGDQYVRYDVATDRVDDGYPMSIAASWTGFNAAGFDRDLSGAVRWDERIAYFFKGNQYLRYDIVADRVDEGYPRLIGDSWPGLAAAGFDRDLRAPIDWTNGSAYLFKGNQYVRYDMVNDRSAEGYPLSISDYWPGFSSAGFGQGVDAAVSIDGAQRATALTADLSDGFFESLRGMARRLRCHPVHLLLAWYSESGVKSSALNPHGSAAGINQLMPSNLAAVGWQGTPQAYSQLSAEAQLPYVERFYLPHAGLGLDSVGRIYQFNFLPATARSGQGPDTVLAERGGINGDAYESNHAYLDMDRDGRITIGDLTNRALSHRQEPRWKEIEGRL